MTPAYMPDEHCRTLVCSKQCVIWHWQSCFGMFIVGPVLLLHLVMRPSSGLHHNMHRMHRLCRDNNAAESPLQDAFTSMLCPHRSNYDHFVLSREQAMSSEAAVEAHEFPDDVLQLIMSFLPLSDRLGSCSIVCQQFRKAALTVTSSVSVDLQADHAADVSFQSWLQQHGNQLSSLEQRTSGPLTALPCANLQELHLSESCKVLLQAADGHAGILAGKTALTKLVCSPRCEPQHYGYQALVAVAALPSLQHLELDFGREAKLPSEILLQQMASQHLTQLHLSRVFCSLDGDSSSTLAGLSKLTTLQVVHLCSCSRKSEPSLASLRSLPLLMDLQVQGFSIKHVQAAVLGTLTQVTKLSLVRCSMTEGVDALLHLTGMEDLQLNDILLQQSQSAVTDFLTCIGSLTQLTSSEVTGVHQLRRLSVQWPEGRDNTALAALTASSRLQHLAFAPHMSSDQRIWGWPGEVYQGILGVQDLHLRVPYMRSLHFDAGADGGLVTISKTCTPDVAQLSSLQEVVLVRCSLQPDVLGGSTQLTRLRLHAVHILPADSGALVAPAVETLLPLLSKLQRLRQLEVTGLRPQESSSAENSARLAGAGLAAYTALLASSKLQSLNLECLLPQGALQHALSIPYQLPALTRFCVTQPTTKSLKLPGLPGNLDSALQLADAMNTDSVDALAERCPNLEQCSLDLQPGAQLSALQCSSALTQLSVNGMVEDVKANLGAVASLSSLRGLFLDCRLCGLAPESSGGNNSNIGDGITQAACQPNLLAEPRAQDVPWSALQQLTRLTSLRICGPPYSTSANAEEVLGAVATVTSLKSLVVNGQASVSAAGLLQLTTFRRLQRLEHDAAPGLRALPLWNTKVSKTVHDCMSVIDTFGRWSAACTNVCQCCGVWQCHHRYWSVSTQLLLPAAVTYNALRVTSP